ncbi:hypothetical protein K0M31_017581, partial [Melipona bicolor]
DKTRVARYLATKSRETQNATKRPISMEDSASAEKRTTMFTGSELEPRALGTRRANVPPPRDVLLIWIPRPKWLCPPP